MNAMGLDPQPYPKIGEVIRSAEQRIKSLAASEAAKIQPGELDLDLGKAEAGKKVIGAEIL